MLPVPQSALLDDDDDMFFASHGRCLRMPATAVAGAAPAPAAAAAGSMAATDLFEEDEPVYRGANVGAPHMAVAAVYGGYSTSGAPIAASGFSAEQDLMAYATMPYGMDHATIAANGGFSGGKPAPMEARVPAVRPRAASTDITAFQHAVAPVATVPASSFHFAAPCDLLTLLVAVAQTLQSQHMQYDFNTSSCQFACLAHVACTPVEFVISVFAVGKQICLDLSKLNGGALEWNAVFCDIIRRLKSAASGQSPQQLQRHDSELEQRRKQQQLAAAAAAEQEQQQAAEQEGHSTDLFSDVAIVNDCDLEAVLDAVVAQAAAAGALPLQGAADGTASAGSPAAMAATQLAGPSVCDMPTPQLVAAADVAPLVSMLDAAHPHAQRCAAQGIADLCTVAANAAVLRSTGAIDRLIAMLEPDSGDDMYLKSAAANALANALAAAADKGGNATAASKQLVQAAAVTAQEKQAAGTVADMAAALARFQAAHADAAGKQAASTSTSTGMGTWTASSNSSACFASSAASAPSSPGGSSVRSTSSCCASGATSPLLLKHALGEAARGLATQSGAAVAVASSPTATAQSVDAIGSPTFLADAGSSKLQPMALSMGQPFHSLAVQ